MSDARFEELMGRLLDEELSADELNEFIGLLRDHPHRLQELQEQIEAADLLSQSQDELRSGPLFVAAVGSRLEDDAFVAGVRSVIAADSGKSITGKPSRPGSPFTLFPPILWTIAALIALVILPVIAFTLVPNGEREIVQITGMSGSLQWTGDGGRVVHDLTTGARLTGGTIEGVSPDAWAQLVFGDGSTVTVSGVSMLTFSEHDQKRLHLREGNIAASVSPQPAGHPMLIHTRSATLEVVGTEFGIEAGLASTTLDVTEGSVRVSRIGGGESVEVPANYRAVASADIDLVAVPLPDAVTAWSSRFDLGPAGAFGKWVPRGENREARVRAIPYIYTQPDGTPLTIYAAAVGVTYGDSPPVTIQRGADVRIQGRLAASHDVLVGFTAKQGNGAYAGSFVTVITADRIESDGGFDVLLPVDAFFQDPDLASIAPGLPAEPYRLVVESFWAVTLPDPAGLELVKIELIPSDAVTVADRGASE